MGTTVDIDDALMVATKSFAERNQKTLKAVAEQALRELLSGPSRQDSDAPPIAVFSGEGVQPGVGLTDNSATEDVMDARSWH